MKSIALIHTVKPILNSFAKSLKKNIRQELKIYEIYDDYLATNPGEIGYFSKDNKKRLYNDILNCSLAKVSFIVVTCSTLTPIVEELRPFFDIPIIAIDDEMCKIAVSRANRIRVLSTAKSTITPTVEKLKKEAKLINKTVEIFATDDEVSYKFMKEGNLQKHDERLLDQIKKVENFDVIVLAQASMAHLAEPAKGLTNIDVIGSIPSCQQKIKQLLLEE